MIWHFHLHTIAYYLFHKKENKFQKQTDPEAMLIKASMSNIMASRVPIYLWPIPAYLLYLFSTTSAFHHHFHQKLGICKSLQLSLEETSTQRFSLGWKTSLNTFTFLRNSSVLRGWITEMDENGLLFDILPWYQVQRIIIWKVPADSTRQYLWGNDKSRFLFLTVWEWEENMYKTSVNVGKN